MKSTYVNHSRIFDEKGVEFGCDVNGCTNSYYDTRNEPNCGASCVRPHIKYLCKEHFELFASLEQNNKKQSSPTTKLIHKQAKYINKKYPNFPPTDCIIVGENGDTVSIFVEKMPNYFFMVSKLDVVEIT